MPEDTDIPTPSPADDAPIPPLESSPEFQERTQEALGGQPTQPPTFRAVGKPNVPAEVAPAARTFPTPAAQKSRPHNPAFDGPGPQLIEAREKVSDLQTRLSRLRSGLEQNLDAAKAALTAVEQDERAEAEVITQGVDLDLVRAFLSFLEDARTIDAE